MKILLYPKMDGAMRFSGFGKAIKHQMRACESLNIDYTIDAKCTDYDILHINTWYPKSRWFAKKAKRNGKKIVYHAHSTEEDFRNSFVFSNLVSPIVKKMLIKAYNLGDVIITPTSYSKKLLEGYGLKPKIYDISNGVDTEKFKRNEQMGKSFRKKYGYKDTDKVIMMVGLFLERKGILDFVEIAKRMPEFEFIWFGFTPLASVPKKIRQAVKTELPNLKFPGYVPNEDILGAMSGADIFLYTTYEETEGIPIVEACAAKINSIIRDIPIFEWLEEGKTVYKAKTNDEFEDKIRKLLNKELPSLVDKAYPLALERDIKVVAEKTKKIYENLMNK